MLVQHKIPAAENCNLEIDILRWQPFAAFGVVAVAAAAAAGQMSIPGFAGIRMLLLTALELPFVEIYSRLLGLLFAENDNWTVAVGCPGQDMLAEKPSPDVVAVD